MTDYQVIICTPDKGVWNFNMNQDTTNRLTEAIKIGNRFFSFTEDGTDIHINLDNVTFINYNRISKGE